MSFVPGLDLSRMLFEEQIAPILAERFPGLKYAAAILGMCSEILGLDDPVSMDHEWGPRIRIFVRIAFMISKTYAPYKKWFGTLFKRLPIAQALEPILLDLLHENDWRQVEQRLGTAAELLLQQQNELGLSPPITLKARTVDDGCHHIKYEFWDIGRTLGETLQGPLKSLTQNQVSWLHERSLILWNGEVGKWSLLLRKPAARRA
jgi:hypothetical protein